MRHNLRKDDVEAKKDEYETGSDAVLTTAQGS